MYRTVKQQVKHLNKDEYKTLRELCHIAKNLYNEALYNVRQHFFATEDYLNYYSNYPQLKKSENYKTLNSNMAQQIIKRVDHDFSSFFALLRKKQAGGYSEKVYIPKYLPKDGFTTLVIGFVRISEEGKLILPYSRAYAKEHPKIEITVPSVLRGRQVKEIRIIPCYEARFFEIHYTYEDCEEQRELDQQKALAVDFGVNNLCTCVTTEGKSFIIDGRRLKSINQWYHKEISRLLQCIYGIDT